MRESIRRDMKISLDRFDVPIITAYGPDWVAVDGEQFRHSLIVGVKHPCTPWDCASYVALTRSHFDDLAKLETELIIFGSGKRLRFPHPEWLAELHARRIGVETMDTLAACRTYNVLASEGRNVVAALLLEPEKRAPHPETG